MTAVIASRREADSLRHSLGPCIAAALTDDRTTDILLNEDGRLWIDRAGGGRQDSGSTLDPDQAERALRSLANHCGVPLTRTAPVLSATLPSGERVAGTIAPVTSRPTFAIRKPPRVTFALDDFTAKVSKTVRAAGKSERVSGKNLALLLAAVEARRNLLIAGSTGSGKTSLLSALLAIPSVAADRMLVIEDTCELRIAAADHVRFLTTPEVGMRDLMRLALRYRRDRIVLGEVRSGDAAIELIHAMNTGHCCSFCTVHANSAQDALGRLEDLCAEVCPQPPCRSIATAIGGIVFVQRRRTAVKSRR